MKTHPLPIPVPNREFGFTLIELLVAMTLLAMLCIALVASIRFGIWAWSAIQTASEQDIRIAVAQTQIQRVVERLYPAFVATTGTDAHVAFDGTATRLTFLAPDEATPGELAWVTVEGRHQQGDFVLVLLRSQELSYDPVPRQSKAVLLHQMRALEFAYFGKPSPGRAPQWNSEWNGRLVLPSLIRIKVAFGSPSARTWTELIVAPRVSADLKCTFDPVSHSCAGRQS